MNKEDRANFASILSSQSAISKASQDKLKQQIKALETIQLLISKYEKLIENWGAIEAQEHLIYQACSLDHETNLPEIVDDLRFWIMINPDNRAIKDLWMRFKREIGKAYNRNLKRLDNIMANADRANIALLNKAARVKTDADRMQKMEISGIDELENLDGEME